MWTSVGYLFVDGWGDIEWYHPNTESVGPFNTPLLQAARVGETARRAGAAEAEEAAAEAAEAAAEEEELLLGCI